MDGALLFTKASIWIWKILNGMNMFSGLDMRLSTSFFHWCFACMFSCRSHCTNCLCCTILCD